jgi:hypothetical protein
MKKKKYELTGQTRQTKLTHQIRDPCNECLITK